MRLSIFVLLCVVVSTWALPSQKFDSRGRDIDATAVSTGAAAEQVDKRSTLEADERDSVKWDSDRELMMLLSRAMQGSSESNGEGEIGESEKNDVAPPAARARLVRRLPRLRRGRRQVGRRLRSRRLRVRRGRLRVRGRRGRLRVRGRRGNLRVRGRRGRLRVRGRRGNLRMRGRRGRLRMRGRRGNRRTRGRRGSLRVRGRRGSRRARGQRLRHRRTFVLPRRRSPLEIEEDDEDEENRSQTMQHLSGLGEESSEEEKGELVPLESDESAATDGEQTFDTSQEASKEHIDGEETEAGSKKK